MKYEIIIDLEKAKTFEQEGRYLEVTKMLITDVKFNFDRLVQSNEELKDIYTSISYLGKDSENPKDIEEKIMFFVKMRRAYFIKIFNEN